MQWLQQGGNKISMWQTEINTCDGTGKPPAYEMIPAIKDLYKQPSFGDVSSEEISEGNQKRSSTQIEP